MNREIIKYTLLSMGAITICLAVYYLYLKYKEKK